MEIITEKWGNRQGIAFEAAVRGGNELIEDAVDRAVKNMLRTMASRYPSAQGLPREAFQVTTRIGEHDEVILDVLLRPAPDSPVHLFGGPLDGTDVSLAQPMPEVTVIDPTGARTLYTRAGVSSTTGQWIYLPADPSEGER